MPVWTDLLKLWTYASEMPDPLKRRDLGRNIDGAGVTQPDVIPDIRQDGSFWGGGSGQVVRLRDSNDFIDLSSVTNRQSRYKEYERLRNTPEIETAMTVYADESCVAGNTLVQTPLGPIPIETLAKTRKPEELFLVYCYNFEKEDFDLGWAFHPRKTGTKETLRLTFNDGSTLLCTPDHKILKRNGEWVEAQHLKEKDEMMAFWRVRPTVTTTNKGVRFAKIFTHHSSFKSERRFIDEFRTELQSEKGKFIDKALHCLQKGLMLKDTAKFLDISEYRLRKILKSEFSNANQITKMHNRFPDVKRIIDIRTGPTTDVYDLSVKTHRNFCTDSAVVHNCQIGDNGRTFEIKTNSKAIKEELEFLFFNPKMLNVDRKIFSWAKNLYVFGDFFLELIIDPDAPGDGIVKVQELPPDSIYRIETIKGKLLEFQQSKEGPDYEALSKVEITQATDQDLMQSTAIRFTPNQIVHFRIGDSRKTFYPYGVSLIEPARGPAHLLRLLEDSMVVYRLCLNPKAKLLTNFGLKKISEVTLGDTVYSYESGALVPSQITNIDIHKKKPVFKIRTKRRTITATGNHPFLTIDEKGNEQYVPAANLKKQNCHIVISPPSPENTPKKIERQLVGFYGKLPEDQKAIFRKAKYDNKSQMIREHLVSVGIKPIKSRVLRRWNWLACHGECRLPLAEAKLLAKKFNLGEPDVCGYSDRKNSPKFNVPEFVNEDIARLLGFIIAAGKINYHNKNKTSGHVRIKDAKNRMQEYCDIAVRSFGRKPDAKSPLKITAIDSIIILESLGLTNSHEYSDKRRYQFPDWIWKERIEIRKAFALGFIEGFGKVRKFKGHWHAYLKTTEATILHNIKALWESCGLSCGRLHRRRRIKKVRITKFFYRRKKVNDGFCLIFSQAQMPKTEKVLKVEYKNIQDVFDITVNHRAENFVAEGIVVHNSRAPERRAFFIDIGNMPPFRGMQLMQSIQDSLRKKKTYNSQAATGAGASPVEERFQPIGQDEDIFVPIKANSMTRIETLPGACLALDTKIPLLDGRTLALSEIISEFESGKTLWAYSCNPTNGNVVPGEITWAGVTKKDAKVLKILLDNGKEVICTPDHKFPILGKGYIEARSLSVGESLIPFNARLEKIKPSHKNTYHQIYDIRDKKWKFTHRMVANFFKNIGLSNYKVFEKEQNFNIIHHNDLNRYNNNPENLYWMNGKDHRKLHQWISTEYASIGGKARANQLSDWKKKDDPRYHEFIQKTQLNFKKWCNNLSKKKRQCLNKKISKSLKSFWSSLTTEDKNLFKKSLNNQGLIGNKTLQDLLKDQSFKTWFGNRISQGFQKFRKTPKFKERSMKISTSNHQRWSDPCYKNNIVAKQTVVFTREMIQFAHDCARQNYTKQKTIKIMNSNLELIANWKKANTHIKRSINFKLTPDNFDKMIKQYGYNKWNQFKQEKELFNHKIISITICENLQDTGTLTIDGNDSMHGYHNFALEAGVFTKNSNLGEIDDAVYFRRKVFIALNFPANYMAQEQDASISRLNLSSVDAKVAKHIERLQGHITDGLMEIAIRHLALRGFPNDLYDDLEIKMTCPYPVREFSLNEIKDATFNRAMAVFGSKIYSHYDVLTKILKHNETEAKDIVARVNAQNLMDLKLQMMAQDPGMMGLTSPQPANNEMGTDANGPNPQLGPASEETPEQNTEQPKDNSEEQSAEDTYGKPEPAEKESIPEPSEEDIERFDMGMTNYAQGLDNEDIDVGELGDE